MHMARMYDRESYINICLYALVSKGVEGNRQLLEKLKLLENNKSHLKYLSWQI